MKHTNRAYRSNHQAPRRIYYGVGRRTIGRVRKLPYRAIKCGLKTIEVERFARAFLVIWKFSIGGFVGGDEPLCTRDYSAAAPQIDQNIKVWFAHGWVDSGKVRNEADQSINVKINKSLYW